MVSTCPLIFKSSRPFTNRLGIVQKTLITIDITVTFMFHCLFFFLVFLQGLGIYLFFRFLLILPAKFTIRQVHFCFWLSLGMVVWSRLGVCISKSQRNLCFSFCRTDSGLCIYLLFIWSNLNFLYNSLWMNFSTQSCLVFYSFCANLLHSLIIWLIFSSLSPHNLHLLFCCVLSLFALVLFVIIIIIIIAFC